MFSYMKGANENAVRSWMLVLAIVLGGPILFNPNRPFVPFFSMAMLISTLILGAKLILIPTGCCVAVFFLISSYEQMAKNSDGKVSRPAIDGIMLLVFVIAAAVVLFLNQDPDPNVYLR